LLDRSGRRPVQLRQVIDEFETRSELVVQRVGIVPNAIETAALRWSLGSEGGHDDVAAGLDGARDWRT
jgi:hypothetical protein